MDSFKLENALANWRREFSARHQLEAEDRVELESGLLDRYDEFLLKGHSSREAFRLAAEYMANPELKTAYGAANQNRSWLALLNNYGKTGWRHLRARFGYNLINYLCLVVGILTTVMALLYLRYETTYDAFVPDVDRKYRVGMNLRSQGYSMISFADYNGTESAVQMRQINGLAAVAGVSRAVQFQTFPDAKVVKIGDRKNTVENLLETNTPADFIDYFGWELLLGSAQNFAAQPLSVLLTAGEAERFYGQDWAGMDFLGQSLRIDTINYTVAGVVADPPANAHFDFSLLIHVRKIQDWGARTYLELAPGTSPELVKNRVNTDFAGINTSLARDELFGGILLQPLRSLHLESDLLYELKQPGDVRYLYLIGLIALIILLLTVSNYVNLAVVMSAGRTREMGMRKVFGATATQVAGQFILEAVILSLAALPLVLLGLWWLLPAFSDLMAVSLPPALVFTWPVLGLLLTVSLLIALLASAYPAFLLARTQVQSLLKGNAVEAAGRELSVRKVVVAGQFILLLGLTSLTLFVNRQLSYIQQKDLGYTKENILYVNLNADSNRFATFREEMLRLPAVTAVGVGDPMGQQSYNQLTYKLAGTDRVFDDARNVYFDYAALAQMEVETSIPEYVADPSKAPRRLVLINNTLATRLKNTFQLTDEELIGRVLLQEPEYVNEETGQVGFPYPIGGVFEDLHMFSLRERIDPMFMTVLREPRYVYWASISYQGISPAELLAQVRGTYEQLGLDEGFNHAFLDENLAGLYGEERRIATLANLFSVLAFLLAIIGLIALTAYLTTIKRKEIGIHKILGAPTWRILWRFNREYWWLLLFALVVTVPLAWWGVSRWLAGFAYRIEVSWWVFLVAGSITFFLTTLVVSIVTLRAARAVPARALADNE